ncbi:biotin-dependent carboxyltransferase family protein [Hansschlegelia quercus]|uniref:Biotin-dependent carboxyltransferase n=1 Tax=Hansschlegelia quercus TaxID=2528245 RepID=A0A4Q9GSU0_9HYPH|nr:biotin-dependent carboxyltransferase family protein [Hansschlegelia quercus]TBN55280.1 biotin-dependent carboxyltransferase [Hansschlegelia quercus]
MASLEIRTAGPGCTVQDAGRRGHLRYGVTAAGPMDPLAFSVANKALGQDGEAAAIEVSLGGIELVARDAAVTVAIAGGAFSVSIEGRALPASVTLTLKPDETLRIRAGAAGAWCYLAVAGGIDVPAILGSRATHTRAGLGGFEGRALKAGDRLAIGESGRGAREPAEIVARWLDRPAKDIRVILGPQADFFAEDQIAAFFTGPWVLSPRSDRMAGFLDGPVLTHAKGHDIVSDGVVMGAVQVPGDGRPIVLMADRQPTGGYPKIATVIGPDLGRFAQIRPGAPFRFRAVTIEEAVAVRREEAARLSREVEMIPMLRTELSSEFLLGLNLIDGVVRD